MAVGKGQLSLQDVLLLLRVWLHYPNLEKGNGDSRVLWLLVCPDFARRAVTSSGWFLGICLKFKQWLSLRCNDVLKACGLRIHPHKKISGPTARLWFWRHSSDLSWSGLVLPFRLLWPWLMSLILAGLALTRILVSFVLPSMLYPFRLLTDVDWTPSTFYRVVSLSSRDRPVRSEKGQWQQKKLQSW